MKGNPEVIKALMDLLADERAAQIQYKVHGGLIEYYGYLKLLKTLEHRLKEEQKHEDSLIDRIIFLGGRPEASVGEIDLGETVITSIAFDSKSEQIAIAKYIKCIKLADENGDYGTSDLLVENLKDEEEHLFYLEQELLQIAQIGDEAFLGKQIKSPKLDEVPDDDV
jgi:bacterioferritin